MENPSEKTGASFPWLFFGLCVAGGLAVSPYFKRPAAVGSTEYASLQVTEDLSCQCNVRGEVFSELSYETAEQCGPERAYLDGPLQAFRKIDARGVFTGSRDPSVMSPLLPKKCFLFAMKHTFPPSFKSELFGQCGLKTPTAEDPSDFTRTAWKPCVNEDLVNIVYNSYMDAVDCFGVPPKFAVAKFMNESGVIPNIVASNNDAGLSQFSTGALAILRDEYDTWSKRILKSNKKSCRNLLNFPSAMPRSGQQIVAEDSKKCHVIQIPSNPVRNFIYYGAFYHIINGDVKMIFKRSKSIDPSTGKPNPSFRSVAQLMEIAKIQDFDVARLQEILAVMAYNTGPKSVIYFKEWLSYRIAKFPTVPIRREDLSMTILPDPWSVIGAAKIEDLKAQYDANGTRAMAFWEWLVVNKKKFRYASYVKFYGNRLDTNLGVGVCTPENFLEM